MVQEECQINCDGPRQVGKQVPWDVAPKQKERVPHDLVSGKKRDDGTVAIEADIRTTTARTTHVHYRGGCEQVRTD